ncbi:uncharacterized protein LOC141524942 [Cotesia typhae]|uniref:uncharacterized protein LOC141524942 n=1 Tax=Cotesia typhae TaxID=2053667 RepID=UPI003D6934C5
MLLIIIIIGKLLIFTEIRGEAQYGTCSPIDDFCSNNNDCCSKKCLYVIERAKSTCVSELENYSASPTSSALFSDIFYMNTQCQSDDDCNYLQSCKFLEGKSYGACTKIPYSLRRRISNIQEPENCTKSGSICEENEECCSKSCGLYSGPFALTCRNKINVPVAKIVSANIRRNCITSRHYCISNDDCCSQKCFTIAMTKYHYCESSG